MDPTVSAEHFASLVDQHYQALYRFAFSLARTEADASDLTQQTFYLWAIKGHQLRDRSRAKAWLFTTLHRVFLGTRHRQQQFPQHSLEEFLDEIPGNVPDVANVLDSVQVVSALARVHPVYQAAVALYYLEEFSCQEIAEVLEVPLGTIKSRISRGIGQLRHLLGVAEPIRPLEPAETSDPRLTAA